MKVLITGGAGFLGINLCRYFLAKQHVVRSLDVADFEYPEKNRVEIIKGDIRDIEIVNRAMKGISVVIHCAAALPLYSRNEIYSIDVLGTKIILDSAHRKEIDRVIHISSTAVYGIPNHHPLYETDDLKGVGPYGEAKIAAEKVCENYRRKGLCVTIIRLKTFIGPERLGVFAIFYDWIVNGRNIPIVGQGKNRYQLLDVRDLCNAIYSAAILPKNHINDVFNIGAKEFTTLREDFGAVLDVAGYGKKVIPTPATPLIWVLRILEILNLSPLYRWVYETAPKDSYVSVGKAERLLGFNPKYSTRDSLIRCYFWYIRNYKKFHKDTGITHRVPWKQGIIGVVKHFF